LFSAQAQGLLNRALILRFTPSDFLLMARYVGILIANPGKNAFSMAYQGDLITTAVNYGRCSIKKYLPVCPHEWWDLRQRLSSLPEAVFSIRRRKIEPPTRKRSHHHELLPRSGASRIRPGFAEACSPGFAWSHQPICIEADVL